MEKDSHLSSLQKKLGYFFSDAVLLLRCLTHVSYGRTSASSVRLSSPSKPVEPGKESGHNETFEFLGDAVLNLAVSDLLMRRFPEKSEGDLSKMRASLVNSVALAGKAVQMELGPLLRMGKGEERSGGREKGSILAGTFEALLGGIYWEGGYEAARGVVERYFAADIKEKKLGQQDYKTRLQEISQMLFRAPPTYRLVAESGPDHEKRFATEIIIGGRILGRGEGKSKKQAEQAAARMALDELQRSGQANGKPVD